MSAKQSKETGPGFLANPVVGQSPTHYVLLYGRHGSKKACELYYYEEHVWDRIEDKCPNISELELDNIEQTGSTCLKNDAIHMVEIVTCDCQFPNLHLGVNTCQN